MQSSKIDTYLSSGFNGACACVFASAQDPDAFRSSVDIPADGDIKILPKNQKVSRASTQSTPSKFVENVGDRAPTTPAAQRKSKDTKAVLTRKIELLMCTATDGIHIIDRQGWLIESSDAFSRMLGYAPEEMEGLHVSDWNPNWNPDALVSQLSVSSDRAIVSETLHRCKDGSLLNVEIRVARTSFDGFEYLCVASRDITERKRIERELGIAAIAFEAQESMFIMDNNKIILRVNRAFIESSGYDAEEVIGKTAASFRPDGHVPAFYTDLWRQIEHWGYWRGEMNSQRKNGEMYPVWLTLTAVKGSDGVITNYVGTQTDITHRKTAEKEIRALAFYDPLTKLANRRLLLDHLQQALADSSCAGNYGALLFIDLDNFKVLNDTAGHEIGDQMLQEVAKRVAICVRDGDTVARLGGDEFVVILAGLNRQIAPATELAEQVGERILAMLNMPYELAGRTYYSSPSIGVTLFGAERETVPELLRRADLAMYQAKSGGRNALRFFDPAMQAAITARAELEGALRQGLKHKQFVLHYQPQITSEGRLMGAEALVRWQHPLRGLLPPSEFISVAEESGLIIPLGLQVMETACRQLVKWAATYDLRDFSIAVNVSAHQFRQHDFVEQVLTTLERTGADPHKLKLELTESLMVDDVEETIAKMTALKARGVGFSLDDFGTGYSSLSYLKRLPLDQLKIDQSFVRNVLHDKSDAAITQMIVALGKSLGLAVIAEGVENQEQRDFLASHHCEAYQGYFFGRPMASKQFASILSNIGRA